MTKSKIKSAWDTPKIKVSPVGESMTKPNQSMDIQDILYRSTTGMAYDNYKTPYYEDEAQFSSRAINKIQDMEPTEKLAYLADVKAQVTSLTKKIKDDEAEKAAKIADAEALRKLEEYNKEKENNTETESN